MVSHPARRTARALWLAVLLAAAGSLTACSDVGDTTALPPGDLPSTFTDAPSGAEDGGADAASDATVATDVQAPDAANDVARLDAPADSPDSGVTTGMPDTGLVVDAGFPDTAHPEAGAPEAGPPDATIIPEAGLPETGAPEAGAPDATIPEAGPPETGAPEAGPPDTGGGGPPETSVPDGCHPLTACPAGANCGTVPDNCGGVVQCGTCAPGFTCGAPSVDPASMYNPPMVISTPGTPNVCASPCSGFNMGGGCSATEQRFVDKSLDCYVCLVSGACIDDRTFGDSNNECEDLTGDATAGAKMGSSNESLCLAKIDCVLASKCSASDIATCYCGTLAGSACGTSTLPGNGACAQEEADGVSHLVTDPASVVSPLLGNKNSASGKADSIAACAIGNGCGAVCLQ